MLKLSERAWSPGSSHRRRRRCTSRVLLRGHSHGHSGWHWRSGLLRGRPGSPLSRTLLPRHRRVGENLRRSLMHRVAWKSLRRRQQLLGRNSLGEFTGVFLHCSNNLSWFTHIKSLRSNVFLECSVYSRIRPGGTLGEIHNTDTCSVSGIFVSTP